MGEEGRKGMVKVEQERGGEGGAVSKQKHATTLRENYEGCRTVRETDREGEIEGEREEETE